MKVNIIIGTEELEKVADRMQEHLEAVKNVAMEKLFHIPEPLSHMEDAVDALVEALADTYYVFQCHVCGQRYATTADDIEMMLRPCSSCRSKIEEKDRPQTLVFVEMTKSRPEAIICGRF